MCYICLKTWVHMLFVTRVYIQALIVKLVLLKRTNIMKGVRTTMYSCIFLLCSFICYSKNRQHKQTWNKVYCLIQARIHAAKQLHIIVIIRVNTPGKVVEKLYATCLLTNSPCSTYVAVHNDAHTTTCRACWRILKTWTVWKSCVMREIIIWI